jgi:murein DD-endopeptidase MepM/ murein hydrolase activator NlpD
MRRVGWEARRQGLDVILCPAHLHGPRTLRQRAFWLRQQLRESVAVPLYAASAHLDAAFERATGRTVSAAIASVAARARWLAGDADAVVDASDVITDRIKDSSPETSEAVAVLTPAAAGLAWPVRSDVISAFGLRYRRLHSGIDVRAGYGTPITAAAGGRVLLADWLGPYGNVTVIDHGGGLSTVYAHQAGLMLPEREAVVGGQVIGFAGSTGRSSGPHLHFEVRVHGTPVDPLAYLS